MDIIKAILLGVIEGVTEWLPISSTGHLIIAEEFIKLSVSASFMEMFRVVIQFGAILAVIVLYWKKLFPFSFRKKPFVRRETLSLWGRILAACLPAAVIGLLFDDAIDALFYNYQTVALTLILYGVLFIVIEARNRNRVPAVNDPGHITYKNALLIGVFQLLALIPGTSRSGATIIGAILLGTSREAAAEFSFFLAVPVMIGASLLKLVKFGFAFTSAELAVLLAGVVTAFVVSLFAIRFLVGFIRKHSYTAFGWYRIALGVIVAAYFLTRAAA